MNHLQVICVLSVIVVAYAGKAPTEAERKMIEECKIQVKATDDDVKSMDEELMPSTRTRLCLNACYLKKKGVLDAENNMNVDKIFVEFDDLKEENEAAFTILTGILKDCHKNYTPVKDECDSIKSFFECAVKSMKDAGIPVEKK